MSETMNLHQVPEALNSHRALWAGRMMSAFVVIALVADGTIQLFAPAQIASTLQETGFALDLTRVVASVRSSLLPAPSFTPSTATAVLGAILVTGFLGGAICAHVRIGEFGDLPPEIISLLLGAMTWGGLYARDSRIRAVFARSSVEPTIEGQCSAPRDQEKKKHMFLVMGITGKVGGATAEHLLAHGKEVRALVRNREKASSWANRGRGTG